MPNRPPLEIEPITPISQDGTITVPELMDQLAKDYQTCNQNADWLRECNKLCSH